MFGFGVVHGDGVLFIRLRMSVLLLMSADVALRALSRLRPPPCILPDTYLSTRESHLMANTAGWWQAVLEWDRDAAPYMHVARVRAVGASYDNTARDRLRCMVVSKVRSFTAGVCRVCVIKADSPLMMHIKKLCAAFTEATHGKKGHCLGPFDSYTLYDAMRTCVEGEAHAEAIQFLNANKPGSPNLQRLDKACITEHMYNPIHGAADVPLTRASGTRHVGG